MAYSHDAISSLPDSILRGYVQAHTEPIFTFTKLKVDGIVRTEAGGDVWMWSPETGKDTEVSIEFANNVSRSLEDVRKDLAEEVAMDQARSSFE